MSYVDLYNSLLADTYNFEDAEELNDLKNTYVHNKNKFFNSVNPSNLLDHVIIILELKPNESLGNLMDEINEITGWNLNGLQTYNLWAAYYGFPVYTI